ncbi:putative DCC family thiol-disulfide oxidoreductase YuxK [Phyllobacterium sp. P30BS-XVII]|nr:putative DCC family thiol-disulfide oxidoreductase YuxK [Phyllobacterium sp. P30BS-XVII]
MDAKNPGTTPSSVELEDMISKGPIIVFDALCVMCSANAQFVLRHDHQHRFRLASMQEPVGMGLYRLNGIDPADPETMIVVEQQGVFRNSDAVLAIYAGLGWPWRIAGLLKAVPRFIRDPIYRFIARNRNFLFGRRETCWLPEAADRDRLL